MAKYFNYFPKTYYSLNDKASALDVATNILTRFKFQEALKDDVFAFYDYVVKDSDTPEIIAHKFYKHSERHWIILLYNNIIDPQYDWPLSYEEFNEFVDKKYQGPEYANSDVKYTGIEWASTNTKSYYKVITRTTLNGSISEKIELDLDSYDGTPETNIDYTLADGTSVNETVKKETESYYQYEERINESKRNIKLLRPEFVPEIEKEFKRVIG